MADADPKDQERATREAARRRVRPIVGWLLEERLKIGRSSILFGLFCTRLRDAGVPLERATIHMPQLHPQLTARSLLWTLEAGGAMETGRQHGVLDRPFYQQSPIRRIYEGAPAIRRRIGRPDCPEDFPILRDLRAEGYSDYILMPLAFSTGQTNAIGFATKQAAGFGELDLATLEAALPAFGAVLELNHLRRTAQTLLDTYVGHDTGTRILNGAVRRGEGEEIHAVLWYCDLRGFTEFSQCQELAPVIALLNDYFDCMARPVAAHGGEILKFIGDAMLAIFPCKATAESKCGAADQAIAAAEDAVAAIAALNRTRVEADAVPLRVGIAIAVGKVMYGNVGAADRLDFTVIGPAVNLVSRLEPLTRDLEPPIVVSEALARASGRSFRNLGHFDLKGIKDAQPAFTLVYNN